MYKILDKFKHLTSQVVLSLGEYASYRSLALSGMSKYFTMLSRGVSHKVAGGVLYDDVWGSFFTMLPEGIL